jgi:hypothetical protein
MTTRPRAISMSLLSASLAKSWLIVGVPAIFVDDSGTHVLSFGASGRLLSWSIDAAAWARQACALAGRNMTKDEWSRYVGGTYRRTCVQWPAAPDE